MRAAIVCFTGNGEKVAGQAGACLRENGWDVSAWCKWIGQDRSPEERQEQKPGPFLRPLEGSLREWTNQRFSDSALLVFIGATGIAVRSIAPFLQSKTKDPAVVCVDEQARFAIPLVSGHIGGANELAQLLAQHLGSIPVVTTATDLNGLFAVDVFARKNQLHISSMQLAKEVSARLLEHTSVPFCSDFPVDGKMPPELTSAELTSAELTSDRPISGRLTEEENGRWNVGIHVTIRRENGSYRTASGLRLLRLVPRIVTLGAGCRRGTDPAEMEAFLEAFLSQNGIDPEAVEQICSIDLKAKEEALLRFCNSRRLPFVTYSAAQLMAVEGSFKGSDFVRQVTGVDNVCERSAVLGSGGVLIARKTARNGMTAAAAVREWRVSFE